jgi:hypothetical protein|tara:strand:+ start:1403 stop:2062 length:660 start_codon:yes stop_codon:yes gene_type:complete
MADIMKHVGKFGSKPCVVVFREVPNEPENCLIVVTGTLADQQHDDLMNIVQSTEAQQSNNISEVFERRQFSTGEGVLSTLHYGKKLQKVPVSQVMLIPTPNQEIALADVNAEIRKIEGGYTPPKNETDPTTFDDKGAQATPVPMPAGDDPHAVAEGLITQANLMEEDGNRLLMDADVKREQAYAMNPKLRGPGRPKQSKAAKKAIAESVDDASALDSEV